MTAAEHLAHFVVDLDLAAISSAARAYAHLCILDTVGIALAGHNESPAVSLDASRVQGCCLVLLGSMLSIVSMPGMAVQEGASAGTRS